MELGKVHGSSHAVPHSTGLRKVRELLWAALGLAERERESYTSQSHWGFFHLGAAMRICLLPRLRPQWGAPNSVLKAVLMQYCRLPANAFNVPAGRSTPYCLETDVQCYPRTAPLAVGRHGLLFPLINHFFSWIPLAGGDLFPACEQWGPLCASSERLHYYGLSLLHDENLKWSQCAYQVCGNCEGCKKLRVENIMF